MRQGRALLGVGLFIAGVLASIRAEAFRNPNVLQREIIPTTRPTTSERPTRAS